MRFPRQNLVQLIKEKNLLSGEVLQSALGKASREGVDRASEGALFDFLVEKGFLDRERVSRLLAEAFGMGVSTLESEPADPPALASVGRERALEYRVFPLRLKGKTLDLAISDPLDLESIDTLGHILGLSVNPIFASEESIVEAINRSYAGPAPEKAVGRTEQPEAETAIAPGSFDCGGLSPEESDPSVARYVRNLIGEALDDRASDIHLEPLASRFRVRFRVDGALLEVESPPRRLQPAILSRLKLMADISIAEKRLPQDGRILFRRGGREVDLRVSTLPTVHGESIVLRILDQDGLKPDLTQLGLESDDRKTLTGLITLPDGIILLTGPTGSGKSTTLYACLNHLNQASRKIITVEDPVEYEMPGINQVQVRNEFGMNFSSALRAILRQAPNIIMVGEIRDLETAEIAIHASLTGHLVFSTLHTNDAPGAVSRLIDIGIKPFLVSASLRAVIAQRLIRTLCEACKTPYSPKGKELKEIGLRGGATPSAPFMEGRGCARCKGRGYRGRKGIFEIFLLGEEIQQMIFEHASLMELRKKARLSGMRTLREDGMRKVSSGLTTIEEILAVTVEEELL